MAKKETHKHYFTLEKEIDDYFMKYIDDNYISKQKLLENLVIKYLQEQKIIDKNND